MAALGHIRGGGLNPMSSRSVYATWMLPVLLYGSENWILTELTKMLDDSKRILKWIKRHSSTAAVVALQMPSMFERVIVRNCFFSFF